MIFQRELMGILSHMHLLSIQKKNVTEGYLIATYLIYIWICTISMPTDAEVTYTGCKQVSVFLSKHKKITGTSFPVESNVVYTDRNKI